MSKSRFSPGDTVRVIDRNEAPDEWAIFIISSIENECCFLTAPDGKNSYEPFWARNEQIVPQSLSKSEELTANS